MPVCFSIFEYVSDGDNFCCFLFPFQAVSWGHGKVWRNIYQNTCSRCFHIVSKYPQAIPCLAHNKTLLGKHHIRTDRTNMTDRKDRIRFLQNVNICWQGEHGPLRCLDVSLCLANHSPHCFPGYLILIITTHGIRPKRFLFVSYLDGQIC